MSGVSPTVTEREARLRERAAFVSGADWRFCRAIGDGGDVPGLPDPLTTRVAAGRYPLPKMKRDRVVPDPLGATHNGHQILWMAREWGHVGEGRLCIVCSWDGGKTFDGYGPFRGHSLVTTTERVALWADLLANPTEEVEVDE